STRRRCNRNQHRRSRGPQGDRKENLSERTAENKSGTFASLAASNGCTTRAHRGETQMKRSFARAAIVFAGLLGLAAVIASAEQTDQHDGTARLPTRIDLRNLNDAVKQIQQGQEIFRRDTFGDEA